VPFALGASFFLPIFLSLGSRPALAQCSTITGPGMSGGGPCPPPQRQYNYPAPKRGSAGGSTYSGGGGGNAGAAIGAAGAALGVLGVLIDAAREAENEQGEHNAARDDEARRQLAARQAYCRRNWQLASVQMQAGNSVMDRWDPKSAMAHFERAIALLGPCDDRKNISIARGNLEIARKRYAAVNDDDRVARAVDRYGDANPYASNRSFVASTADASASDKDQTSDAMAKSIVDEATKLCASIPAESQRWQSCKQTQEARLIRQADAEIDSACKQESSMAARDVCAVKSYVEKLRRAKNAESQNCYFDKAGRPCITDGGMSASGKPQADSHLREELRARLARKASAASANAAASETATGAPGAEAPEVLDPAVSVRGGAVAKPDGALEAYLNGQNGSTGTRNDGNLNTTDFRMDAAETRREVDRLTKP
jgi:hypothetical protein